MQTKMLEVTEEIQTIDPRRRPQPEEGPLTIIYEDDWMLVANKPPGVVVHPTYKNTSGTLLNAVLWRVRERPGRPRAPTPVTTAGPRRPRWSAPTGGRQDSPVRGGCL